MRYKVKAECVDTRDGTRYFPGQYFKDPTADQIERLTKAKCLEEEKATKGKAPVDDLDKQTVDQLRELATKEEVVVAADATATDLIAAIRAKRQPA
jgi:hypothetical protein